MTTSEIIYSIIKLEKNPETAKDADVLKDKLSPSDYMIYLNITNQIKF